MANVTLRNGTAFGVTISQVTTAITGTLTGAWITNLQGCEISGVAFEYDEGSAGTFTQAVVTFDAQAGGTSVAFNLQNSSGAELLSETLTDDTATVDGLVIRPFVNLNGVPALIRGIDAMRAVAVIAGTGGTASLLKITLLGREMPYTG